MIAAGVQHNEIDNITEAGAVSEVAQNACEQKRTSSENAIVASWSAHEVIKDCHRSQYGQDDEKPPSERAAFLQLSKRDARVFSVDELEEATDDHALFTKAKCFDSPCF